MIHGHGQPELEVLVEHLPAERHSLAEHLHGHETQGFAIHEKPVALDGGQPVDVGHVPDPDLHVFAHPGAGI